MRAHIEPFIGVTQSIDVNVYYQQEKQHHKNIRFYFHIVYIACNRKIYQI